MSYILSSPSSPFGALSPPNPFGPSNPFGVLSPISISPISTEYPVSSAILSDSPIHLGNMKPDKPFLVTTTDINPLLPTLVYPYGQSIPITFYENLNADPRIQKRIAKNLYYKVLDNWLYDDLSDILNYFRVRDGRVELINTQAEYDPLSVEKEPIEQTEKKIDFIEKFFFTREMMRKLLQRYIRETGINWIDLPKHTYFIKQLVKDKIMRNTRTAMAEKQKLSKA